MEYKEWQKRKMGRADLSHFLVHLTRENKEKNMSSLDVLFKILNDKKLIGSTTQSGFIVGGIPATCFQDAPLFSVGQNIWFEDRKREGSENERMRYSAFGLLFSKSYIYKNNGRPVIYDKTEDAKNYLDKSQWWKIVNLDLSDPNKLIDWTHEREWRVPDDLVFDFKDVSIILPNDDFYRNFVNLCLDNGKEDILKNICGIVNLSRIY